MPRGRPHQFRLTLSDTERAQLTALAHSRALAHGLVRRAQIILRSVAGEPNTAIARRLNVSMPLVSYWRRRYRDAGLAGLYDAPRSGRPRTHDDDRVARMLRTVLQSRPKDATHWTVRSVAEKTRISKSTVQRYFTLFGVQPHRTRSFKLSPDPFFVEKVRDIVGSTSIPLTRRSSCASTRRVRFRRSSGRSPICPWAWGMSKASRTITPATGPRRSLRR